MCPALAEVRLEINELLSESNGMLGVASSIKAVGKTELPLKPRLGQFDTGDRFATCIAILCAGRIVDATLPTGTGYWPPSEEIVECLSCRPIPLCQVPL